MKRILLTSPKSQGHIELIFKQNGMLAVLNMQDANLSFEQLRMLLGTDSKLPLHEDDMQLLPSGLKATPVKFEVSFDDFYNPYEPKHNRQRCIPLWNKMSNADQYLAVINLREYQLACARIGRKVADPEKYLRDKYYLTNWKQY